jgi:esterase/lipase superfamily enzyme
LEGEPSLGQPNEITRFPNTPYRVERVKGGIRRDPTALAAHRRSASEIQQTLQAKIATTASKEVVLYVHGFNNSFDDAVKSVARMCNDLGPNNFTCIVFSWPAGGEKGAFFGYNFDRESGEFSVTDLKKAVRFIAKTPGLKKLHFVSHSRGADIVTSVIQQLNAETYAIGKTFMNEYKIGETILAAPDIDIDVAVGKFSATISDPDIPRLGQANYGVVYNPVRIHLTVYATAGDAALDMSRSMSGNTRLGLVDASSSNDGVTLVSPLKDVVDLISVEQSGSDLFGHNYFLSSRNVRGDIVALIRDKKVAGKPRRELEEIQRPFWRLPLGAYSTGSLQ